MASHSSILAWEIPWTEEPGRLQSMGSQHFHFYMIMDKFKISRVGQQSGDLGNSHSSSPKKCLLAEFLLAQRKSAFVLFRPSTVWMRPTLIMEGNLPYSKLTNLNVNVIQKKSSQKYTA